ncbi:sensor histidine kinase [Lutispora thermophila]|uniref:histidine kinase n=1 Tax=Lutispora thermophila DSM 19022 TaxID=1122184 RepID=A0A1M6FFW9_9FIRM|nr:ATP-binding protein [Lutispora thermophila]SHI96628.1 two-component system, sensor histidine kinase YcbA [Lutispora thermophila DSM 19022]
MNKAKHTFLIAACVALASQFNFKCFVPGFIITLSVILLPIFLYNYVELNPIVVCFTTGIVSPLFRGIIEYLEIKDAVTTWVMVAPDVFFYFSYGIFYYFLYYKEVKEDLTRFFTTAFFCDFLSNIVEMSIRINISSMSFEIIRNLMAIALVRAFISVGVVISIKHYRAFLDRVEHEERYRRLVLLTSSFKSEIYFMSKNIKEIEDVMKKSYYAYKLISENDYPEELKHLALDISKDVHEIKKGYLRIISGLEEISKDKTDETSMSIRDIIRILEIDTKDFIRLNKLDIQIYFNTKVDFYVEEHYYLMSILKNLINNSIEALERRERGFIKLNVCESGEDYIFIVSDNGEGIKPGNIDYIFNPGFSTKFDESTGNIGRGLGLALVKDLTNSIFYGSITVQSEVDKGTSFTITIPKNVFRGENDEVLYCG